MAEVMNDLSNSNDELRETNGNHRSNDGKLNGPSDDRENESECNSLSKDVASSPITKKQVADLAVEKLFELSDKNAAASGPVANGHLKLSSDSNRTSSTSCENTKDLTTSGDDTAADSSSSSAREENERHNKVAGSLRPEDFDAHDAVLNLKTNTSRCNQDAMESVKVDGDSTLKTDGVSSDEATLPQCESSTDENDGAKAEKNRDGGDDFGPSDSTSDKQNGKKMKKSPASTTVTPRRSSRNLNKPRSYNEKDLELAAEELIEESSPSNSKRPRREDNDIEEITPTDPFADNARGGRIRGGGSGVNVTNSKTIVVSDTKGLVEFASNTKASRSNKKEPTLVIIDTNSILAGRGPVPVSTQSNSPMLHSSPVSTPISMSLPISASALAARGVPSSTSAFSVIPIELSTPSAYTPYKCNNPPPQMKPLVIGPASSTTGASSPITLQASSVSITTVPSSSVSLTSKQVQQLPPPPPPLSLQQQHQLQQPSSVLPSLTDDMFVVEAPSFIVPYVYEKPPMGSLKEYTVRLERELEELEEEEKRREREKCEKEDAEKQKNADTTAKTDVSGEDVEMKDANDDKETTSEADSTVTEEKTALEQEKKDGVESKESTTTEKPSEIEKKDELSSTKDDKKPEDLRKPLSYFDNPLGKFFMQIGLNLVQEHVQTDLLRSQKRKRDKEGDKCSPEVHAAIETLQKTLESSKENNDPFKLSLRKCELCSFKTESTLVMAHHLETPHMKNYTYRCNFCPLEVRSPHDILFHMEAEHNIRGRLERAPAFHQCPNCPFEDNQKGKLTRHLVSCLKKYRPERNQEPPLDWEPPAKIPRVTRNRPPPMTPNNAVYQAAMSGLKQVPQNSLLPKLIPSVNTVPNMKHSATSMPNKRQQQPITMPTSNFVNRFSQAPNQPSFPPRSISVTNQNQGVMYRPPSANSTAAQVLFAQNYQLSGAQIYQQNANSKIQSQPSLAAAKLLNQPSISITPLPRQSSSAPSSGSSNLINSSKSSAKACSTNQNNKNSFVVCEICDGYIKDLEQLRNHMQWIHKVKIHPKMIYNRPPLNCQKCQFRFFTDQGLERHLLGSHGLVTSSMQEAANKGKDNGRCPICGRVYQWKLLNHVARDHQMALKPAHLSYKCTVCTATFGMYKQFESHVYSAHSVVAKRAMDTKKPPVIPSSSVNQSEALLKPLKINDEITIIPQPVRTSKTNNKPNMPLCLPKSSLATISTTIKKM